MPPECGCVSRVRGRSDSVRDSSATAPICPYVTNACATALRRSCGYGVTRTGRPGECLCGTVSSSVHNERETGRSCLNGDLNGWSWGRCRSRRWCCGRRRSCSRGRGRGWGWSRRTALRRCTHLNRIGTFPTCVGAAGVGGRHRVVISGSVDKSGIDNAGSARAGKRFIRTAVDHRSFHVVAACSNRRRPRERDLCIAGNGSQARRGRQIDK